VSAVISTTSTYQSTNTSEAILIPSPMTPQTSAKNDLNKKHCCSLSDFFCIKIKGNLLIISDLNLLEIF
jgi:hypothetical protein